MIRVLLLIIMTMSMASGANAQSRLLRAHAAAGSSIAFTALANGTIGGSPIAGSGTYAGTAPSGISSATWGGTGCSGSSTVTSFSAGGGTWSATFTVPGSGAGGSTCNIAITDNLSDTATSPNVTISASGLCPGAGALGGNWTLVACISQASSDTTSVTTTTPVDCATGGTNLIVLIISRYGNNAAGGLPTSAADSSGNTYTTRIGTQAGGSAQSDIVAIDSGSGGIAPTVTTTMTFTLTYGGTANYPGLTVLCIKDASGSPTFGTANDSNIQTSASSLATGSLTPGGNGHLLISGISTQNDSPTATATIGSGFTYATGAIGVSGFSQEVGGAAFYQATAAAINPTWTFGAAAGGSAAFIMDYAP